jgi:hypothetical protein
MAAETCYSGDPGGGVFLSMVLITIFGIEMRNRIPIVDSPAFW